MIITKKLVTVGASLGVIIDKTIVKEMKLKKGDWMEIKIKKAKMYG